MMNEKDRNGYLGLLEEIEGAIKAGESMTRETKELFDYLAEKIESTTASVIETAKSLIPDAPAIKIENERWHRSSPLKFRQTPFGTQSSRLHAGRYNKPGSAGAIYITNSAEAAAAERKLAVREQAFYTFPLDANLNRILDLTTQKSCDQAGVNRILLGIEWQFVHDILEKSPYTQMIGDIARSNLFEGIQFESVRFKGARNIVLFPEVMQNSSFLRVHDPDGVFKDCEPGSLVLEGII